MRREGRPAFLGAMPKPGEARAGSRKPEHPKQQLVGAVRAACQALIAKDPHPGRDPTRTGQDVARDPGAGPADEPRSGPYRPELRLRAQSGLLRRPRHPPARPLPRSGRTERGGDDRPGDRARRRRLRTGTARRGADLRRHQFGARGDPGQAAQDPDLPHGGGQPLLRPAGAGGDQPQGHRPLERRQPRADRACPPLPPGGGAAGAAHLQGRLAHGRGARRIPPEDRGLRRAGPARARAGPVLHRLRPPRGERRFAGPAAGLPGRARPPARRLRPAHRRLDPSAHPCPAGGGGRPRAPGQRALPAALRLHRLREAPDERPLRPVGQRHHRRGGRAPRPAGGHVSRRARAARGHGCRHADRGAARQGLPRRGGARGARRHRRGSPLRGLRPGLPGRRGKVVRIVLSYIDQVNHTVWSKPGPF